MARTKRNKAVKVFSNQWMLDSFLDRPDFYQKRMFGGLAAYLDGRMVLVLTENPGEKNYRGKSYAFDIWNGVLLPTEREFHQSLTAKFPALKMHPVLGKWLYLPEADDAFEQTATDIVEAILGGDERFGIYPKVKIRQKSKITQKKSGKKV